MMNLEQIRASLQSQMDAWQAMVKAFEVQMNLGKREAIDRLEQQKQFFGEGLDRLKTEVERSRGLVDTQRQSLTKAFEELRLQLSLGRAETRDLFAEQQKSLHESIAKLDKEINRNVDSLTDTVGQGYVRWVDTVKAEYEAASAHFAETQARQKENWEAARQSFEKQLENYHKQLSEAQKHAMEQAQHFQSTLATGMDHLRESFTRLFQISGKGGEK
jgi:ABC-type transporter Mla subunit MlaD